MRLPAELDREAFFARRAKLQQALAGRPALIAAGLPSPRNAAAHPRSFRASSHFLYLVGAHLPGAFLLLERDQVTLYVDPPSHSDALWEGPSPTLAQQEAALGCRVRPLPELTKILEGRQVATLPDLDPTTCERQSSLLSRVVRRDNLSQRDEGLAEAMINLRLIHDEAAIAGLREATQGTAEAFAAGRLATRPGVKEWHVRAAMEAALIGRGHWLAFAPIVSAHGEVLHNPYHHGTLAEGDLLLADVGAETAQGWAGDVTRVWPVSGRFSATQRELYEAVLATQLAAIQMVKPGVRFKAVHLAACLALTSALVDLGILKGDVSNLVERGAHTLFFPHGVGHLLGLDVHDMEDLGDRAGYPAGRSRDKRFGWEFLRLDRDLVEGMAVTIEPGFYQVPAILEDAQRLAPFGDAVDLERLARFSDVRGIRIEDDLLVTASGSEVLTSEIPKTVAALEA